MLKYAKIYTLDSKLEIFLPLCATFERSAAAAEEVLN